MSTDSPQVAALKERYKASFPEKVEIIKSTLDTVSSNGDLELVKEELHKLAGSSGMYGYQDLAAFCRGGMDKAERQDRGALLEDLNKIIDLLTDDAY